MCTRKDNAFKATWWFAFTSNSVIHAVEFQTTIRTKITFLRLICSRLLITLCGYQCNMFAAHGIRSMIPAVVLFISTYVKHLRRSVFTQQRNRVSFVTGLNHTFHNTNFRRPCTTFLNKFKILAMVRFLAYFQIKQHVPLLVLFSVKSFNFNSCEFTHQVEYLTRKLYQTFKKTND